MSDQPPAMRSDGQGPHPPVQEMFVTKDDFYSYVLDNRDRQDKNKIEIIAAMEIAVDRSAANCQEDVNGLTVRVGALEKDSKKQTLIAAAIASLTAIVTGIITSIAVYFGRGG